MITDNAGPVDIEVPRDRAGTFEPVIVAKHQRRLSGVDRDRVVAEGEGPDDWGDQRPLR